MYKFKQHPWYTYVLFFLNIIEEYFGTVSDPVSVE